MSAASGKSSPRLASLLLVGSLIHSNRVQGLWLSGNRRLEPPRALLRSASAASASAAAAAVETTLLSDTTAPLPKLRPHEVRCGEQQWVDDLFHLRDPEDPSTAAHLEACARHAAALHARLRPIAATIQSELLAFGAPTPDAKSLRAAPAATTAAELPSPAANAPELRWAKLGPWEWARDDARGEYPAFWRRPPSDGFGSSSGGNDARLCALDANLVPVPCRAAYAGGQPFLGACRGVSAFEPEPSKGAWVAYTVDRDGDEKYTLVVAALADPAQGGAAGLQVLAGATDVDAPVAWGGPVVAVRADVVGLAAGAAPLPPTRAAGAGMGMAPASASKKGAAKKQTAAPSVAAAAAGATAGAAAGSEETVGGGHYIYYARMDDTGRPFQLYQRRVPAPGLGSPKPSAALASAKAGGPAVSTAGSSSNSGGGVLSSLEASSNGGLERLVFEEPDRSFRLTFRRNRAGTALLVRLASRDGDEWRRLPLNPPSGPPRLPRIEPPLSSSSSAAAPKSPKNTKYAQKATAEAKQEVDSEGASSLTDVVVPRALKLRCELDEAADGTLHLLAAALPNDGFNNAAGAERMPGEEKLPCELRHAVAEVAPDAAPAARHSAPRLWRWSDSDGGGGGASCDVLSGVHCFAQGRVVLEGFDAHSGQRAVWTSRNGSARCRVRAGGRGVWLDDGSVAWAANREDAPPDAGVALAASSLAAPTNPLALRPSGHEASHGPDTPPAPPPNAANAQSAAWWSNLEAETLLVPTSDGENVPVSLVCLKGRADAAGAHGDMDLWGSVVLYGYGAYGAACEATFDPDRLPLLRRGAAFAVAHVRGGGEKGAAWHAAGARLNKGRGVQDFLDVARFLLGRTATAATADHLATAPRSSLSRFRVLAAEGRSAGGYLVGAALNADPTLFAAALLEVPFVDPLGTLADASLPLTVNEWAEFGNPSTQEGFNHLARFSPASNVQTQARPQAYPPLLLRPAAKDARTGWWEAFKLAARVNAANAANAAELQRAAGATPQAPKLPAALEVATGAGSAAAPAAPAGAADAVAGGLGAVPLAAFGAVVDMTAGGHFRPAGRTARAAERSQELAFLVAALHEALSAAPLEPNKN